MTGDMGKKKSIKSLGFTRIYGPNVGFRFSVRKKNISFSESSPPISKKNPVIERVARIHPVFSHDILVAFGHSFPPTNSKLA